MRSDEEYDGVFVDIRQGKATAVAMRERTRKRLEMVQGTSYSKNQIQSTALACLGRLMQPDLHFRWRRRGSESSHSDLRWIQVLDPIKVLQHPHNHISRLSQRELRAKTDSRPTIERQIFPSTLATFPPLRPELISIITPQIFPSVHDEDIVEHLFALLDIEMFHACESGSLSS